MLLSHFGIEQTDRHRKREEEERERRRERGRERERVKERVKERERERERGGGGGRAGTQTKGSRFRCLEQARGTQFYALRFYSPFISANVYFLSSLCKLY